MNLAQPFVRPSAIQAIDPRCRLAAALILCLGIGSCQGLASACLGLACGVFWLVLAMSGAHAPWQALFARLAAVNFFVLLLWLTCPWATPGTAVLDLGPLTITSQGLHLAEIVTLKANALACLFLALLASQSAPVLGSALRFFHCPERLILIFLMSIRNISLLSVEWQRLRTAARLRGFVPATSLHTWRTTAALLALLILRSLDRAERLREAMLLRGFNGKFALAANGHLGRADIFFALAVLAQLTSLAWLEFGVWS